MNDRSRSQCVNLAVHRSAGRLLCLYARAMIAVSSPVIANSLQLAREGKRGRGQQGWVAWWRIAHHGLKAIDVS